MNNDWRLTNQFEYLYMSVLHYAKFTATVTRDHEHCEFCMEKICEHPENIHEGYCTYDRYRWICVDCFNDFKNVFEWIVENDSKADNDTRAL